MELDDLSARLNDMMLYDDRIHKGNIYMLAPELVIKTPILVIESGTISTLENTNISKSTAAVLSLCGNKIQDLLPLNGMMIFELYLFNCNFNKLDVSTMPNLVHLNISYNNLTRLNIKLDKSKVKELDISGNPLEDIEELKKSKVEELCAYNIPHNILSQIPKHIKVWGT